MNLQRILLLVLVFATLGSRSAMGQEVASSSAVGRVEGVVIYESDRRRPWRYRRYYVLDREKGHLAEAVVSLPTESDAASSDRSTHVIDQKDYRFIPETIAIRAGDAINFKNSDPFVHDVTSNNPLKRFSFTLGSRDERREIFPRAGGLKQPIKLNCKFHSSMRCWIYVFDYPHFQVTDLDGRFAFDNVPAGVHKLEMYHPAGELHWLQSVDVRAGETSRIEIRVSPDDVVGDSD